MLHAHIKCVQRFLSDDYFYTFSGAVLFTILEKICHVFHAKRSKDWVKAVAHEEKNLA
jgi:hypothetical protein